MLIQIKLLLIFIFDDKFSNSNINQSVKSSKIKSEI